MTCSSCPHYSALDMSCRRRPPTLFPVPTATGVDYRPMFPRLEPTAWCSCHPDRERIARGDLLEK